jgi:formylglycine-generating enzyme required for sulfatase activity
MSKYEVTWDEYRLFMFAKQAGETVNKDALVDAVSRPTRPYVEMSFGMGINGYPAISMTQHAANKYAEWLSAKTGQFYRLPTEAEWEYAARAGTETAFWWGRALVKGNANCEDCGDGPQRKTLPVQSFRPNGFGLFDVAGNVAEWVEDCWNDTYRGAPANGTAWTTGQCAQRGLRGGSFASRSTFVRSSARFRYDQDVRYYANGFRVARDLK